MKIVSLSFDDGTIYDLRFIELLNKYNLKATLNLNSELKDFVWYYNNEKPIKRLDLEKVKAAYAGQRAWNGGIRICSFRRAYCSV
jgi:hypothetical protein